MFGEPLPRPNRCLATISAVPVCPGDDLACKDLACKDLACKDLACKDLACKDLACKDLACKDLADFPSRFRDTGRPVLRRRS